mmetsp:Transcript_817/g.1038  ORF Transcript_817/g.1038 Transcript_817/m.1038 type:complete len:83 (-) Transcript_817:2234-2482(-)
MGRHAEAYRVSPSQLSALRGILQNSNILTVALGRGGAALGRGGGGVRSSSDSEYDEAENSRAMKETRKNNSEKIDNKHYLKF